MKTIKKTEMYQRNCYPFFLPKDKYHGNIANGAETSDPLAEIDFNAPKIQKKSLEELAAILDYELYEKEWFVTGLVNPIYFADDFEFQDPDVKIDGIEGELFHRHRACIL